MKKISSHRYALPHPLRINRETLRNLDAHDLKLAAAAFSGTSICTATTNNCCDTR